MATSSSTAPRRLSGRLSLLLGLGIALGGMLGYGSDADAPRTILEAIDAHIPAAP